MGENPSSSRGSSLGPIDYNRVEELITRVLDKRLPALGERLKGEHPDMGMADPSDEIGNRSNFLGGIKYLNVYLKKDPWSLKDDKDIKTFFELILGDTPPMSLKASKDYLRLDIECGSGDARKEYKKAIRESLKKKTLKTYDVDRAFVYKSTEGEAKVKKPYEPSTRGKDFAPKGKRGSGGRGRGGSRGST
jgi:hypothetical protein